jgi:hypothetical protein
MFLNMVKGGNPMGWADSKKDAANRGGFVCLKKDKESVDLVALTEPELTEKPGFQGGEKRTVYRVLVTQFPVEDGGRALNLDLGIFAFNAYLAAIGEDHECKTAFTMTRNGKEGDTNTRYTFKLGKKLGSAAQKLCRKIASEQAF